MSTGLGSGECFDAFLGTHWRNIASGRQFEIDDAKLPLISATRSKPAARPRYLARPLPK